MTTPHKNPEGRPSSSAYTHRSSTVCANTPLATMAVGIGSAPGEGLVQQVQMIKETLSIDAKVAPPMAIKQANELMGLPNEGTLPEQAEKLMEALGL